MTDKRKRTCGVIDLLSLTALVFVGLVFASPASAQTLEVVDEAFGNHCPSVWLSGTDVDGGCLTHVTSNGTVEIRKHINGIETVITTCSVEYAVRLDENADGYILEQSLSGSLCPRRACTSGAGEGEPWPVNGFEGTPQGTAEGTEYLTRNFCVETLGGIGAETCELDFPFQSYQNQHRQEYGHDGELASHGISGFKCELVGHWNSETGGTHDGQAEQEVMVKHTDDPPPDTLDPEQEIVITHTDDGGGGKLPDPEQEIVITHVD